MPTCLGFLLVRPANWTSRAINGILDVMDVVLPPVVDPVGEALHFLRMSGTLHCRSEFTAPWALDIPPLSHSLMLHVVTAGRCVLELGVEPARTMELGDLALVPHGRGHQLASEPGLRGAKLFDTPREQQSERHETLNLGGGGERTSMICAMFQFDHPAAQHLVQLLPACITVNSWNSPHADWIQSTLRLMASEAKELRPGGETIIARLADILVIHVIRTWITQDSPAQIGWLGALQDKQIGQVIARIHREPERAWTLESLAAEAAMSRSAFSARFTELVGESAMHYLTRWRMLTALTWLREGEATVGDIARRLGYESEAAFSRAYKRHMGLAPGAVRRKDGSSPLRAASGAS